MATIDTIAVGGRLEWHRRMYGDFMLYACRVDLLGANGYAFDDKRYSHHANCDYDLLSKGQ